jgi:hypothetical protein
MSGKSDFFPVRLKETIELFPDGVSRKFPGNRSGNFGKSRNFLKTRCAASCTLVILGGFLCLRDAYLDIFKLSGRRSQEMSPEIPGVSGFFH